VSVRQTSARIALPPTCFGHIDRRSLLGVIPVSCGNGTSYLPTKVLGNKDVTKLSDLCLVVSTLPNVRVDLYIPATIPGAGVSLARLLVGNLLGKAVVNMAVMTGGNQHRLLGITGVSINVFDQEILPRDDIGLVMTLVTSFTFGVEAGVLDGGQNFGVGMVLVDVVILPDDSQEIGVGTAMGQVAVLAFKVVVIGQDAGAALGGKEGVHSTAAVDVMDRRSHTPGDAVASGRGSPVKWPGAGSR
jgi:hypothetical protein